MLMFLLLFAFPLEFADGQDACRTPNGDGGTCILLETCQPLIAISKKTKKTSDDILFLRQSSCGLHLNTKPKVCCPPRSEWPTFTTVKPLVFPLGNRISGDGATPTPETPTRTVTVARPPVTPRPAIETVTPEIPESTDACRQTVEAPDKDSLCCGLQVNSADKITNGRVAEPDQFPWLTLIEYDNGATGCGGSLISARYVLTAAHCIGNTVLGIPIRVRLSEYNKTSYPIDIVESSGGGFEEVTVVIINILKEIPHPQYVRGTKQNDIGLIKLALNAPYTEFIRPICLPYEDVTLRRVDEDGLRFEVAGWGSNGTVFSDVKQYVNVPLYPLDNCRELYASRPPRYRTKLSDRQICAGGEFGKDSCSGDSGGPLMFEDGDTYIVVGIVSYGDRECGREGIPGIYTNVYQYVDWIKKQMV